MAFEHFLCPLSGEFDHKFGPMLRTFVFYLAEDWVHNLNLTVQSYNWVPNLCSRRCHLGDVNYQSTQRSV